MYQDIPVLGDSSKANIIDEERKMLFHALAMKGVDLDFLNSPLYALADVAAQGMNHAHWHHFPPGEKENDLGVPITAPVPLSYAARGKAALQSILFMEEDGEEGVDSPTAQGNEQQIYAPISETSLEERTTVFQRSNASGFRVQHGNHQVAGNSGHPVQPPMIIRPITPSTLMALTDPCLMAWCSISTLDKRFPTVNVPVAVPRNPIAAFDRTGRINNLPTTDQNSWGY